MYEFQNKIVKVFTSKSVGTGPSSYKKRSYRAAVSQRLRNTELEDLQGSKPLSPLLKQCNVLEVGHPRCVV